MAGYHQRWHRGQHIGAVRRHAASGWMHRGTCTSPTPATTPSAWWTAKGIITTVAGIEDSPGYQGDGFGAASAELLRPSSIVFDSAGNMYIADSGNNVIRKVTAPPPPIRTSFRRTREIYNGGLGVTQGMADRLPKRSGLTTRWRSRWIRPATYILPTPNNNVVRKVTASTGIITTIAGNGNPGFSGDGGAARCWPNSAIPKAWRWIPPATSISRTRLTAAFAW